MKTLMLATTFAAACAFAAASAPVFAQPANSSSTNKPAAVATNKATTKVAAKTKTKAKDQHAVPAPGSRNCIRHTGSLIPAPKGKCLPVAGSSYSQKDMQRTGAANTAQALQMLDPSIRVGGG